LPSCPLPPPCLYSKRERARGKVSGQTSVIARIHRINRTTALAGALSVRVDGHRVLRPSAGATRTHHASVRETAGTNVGEASLMSKPPETSSLRVLFVQILSHALIFGAQNTGGLAERALLAADTAATATLGVSWIAFCL